MKLINLYEIKDEIEDFEEFKERLRETGTYVEGENLFYVNGDRILEVRPELAQAVEDAEDWSGRMMTKF